MLVRRAASVDDLPRTHLECRRTLDKWMGEHRISPISWETRAPEDAGPVLDQLLEGAAPALVHFYDQVRAELRAEGGYLVVAWAQADVDE